MSILSSSVSRKGKATLPLGRAMIPASSNARDHARSLREDNWENEGGHLASEGPRIASSAISANDVDALAEQVRVLDSTLASDFANGRVGMRYNSYAHRSRVLRQQKAKLDLLQVSMRSQEPQS